MKYPYLQLKKKMFYEIQVDLDLPAVFSHPFNAALGWLHIHILRQGTTEDISDISEIEKRCSGETSTFT